jgi:hypothetical protein
MCLGLSPLEMKNIAVPASTPICAIVPFFDA